MIATLTEPVSTPPTDLPPGALPPVPELPKLLSPGEHEELRVCEGIIERNMMASIEMATALTIVHEKRLWRADYNSWEEYLQERWGFTARRARQLLQASRDIKALGLDAPGFEYAMPASEKHLRLLRRLPESQRREAWFEAVRTAGHKGVTAGHLETVVRSRLRAEDFPPNSSRGGEQSGAAAAPSPVGPRSRTDRLREQTDIAIKDVRELLTLAGTADSTKAAELNRALVTLQDYRDHLAAKQNLYASRK
jgi:hypothetical protein